MVHFPSKRHLVILVFCILLIGVIAPVTAFAKSLPSAPTPAKGRDAITVVPFEFDPGHTDTVESSWVPGEGLQDQRGTQNEALLLTKLSKTATNAASGATVTHVRGLNIMELGFAVRSDGHCGAGAPRFNVVTSDGTLHFAGCAAAATNGMTTDPQGNLWLIKRFDTSSTSTNVFPPFAPGSIIQSISIIFDEGVDSGQGWTYLDNIDINGTLIGQGPTG